MADLTNEEIAELRRLHEEATPGPWVQNRTGTSETAPLLAHAYAPESDYETVLMTVWPSDTAAAVAAFNALPRLLDEVERLRAEKANLRRALIASGKAVGCVLSDAVSDEFLMGVPQEVLACVAKLRAELERRERMDSAGS